MSARNQANIMEKDEWYGKIVADTGNEVSGGAGLLVRIKRGGGMKTVAQRIGAKAAQEVLDELNAPPAKQRPNLRIVRRAA
jgi:hypothetical protein